MNVGDGCNAWSMSQCRRSHPERIVEHGLVLQNAIYRLARVTPAWTRCLILLLRYTAISDDKRTGIIKFGLNLANGSALDPFVDDVFTAALSVESAAGAGKGAAGRATAARLARPPLAHRGHALCPPVQAHLRLFLQGMQRRLERDLERMPTTRACVRKRGSGCTNSIRTRRVSACALRQPRGSIRQVADTPEIRSARHHRAGATLILTSPVQRLELTIKRRKGERQVALDWHPLVRRLDPPPCEWSSTAEITRVVCDDACTWSVPPATRHVRSVASYCRACQPRRCPKCGQAG